MRIENVLIDSSIESLTANFDDPTVDAIIWERTLTPAALFFQASEIVPINIRLSKITSHLMKYNKQYLEDLTQDLQFIKRVYCRLLPNSIDNLNIDNDLEAQIRVNSYTSTSIWHTDRLGVIRVLVNYLGQGTEWVPNSAILEEVKDPKSIPDAQIDKAKICQVPPNSVVFIKCPEYVPRRHLTTSTKLANQLGFIHRTPAISPNEKRLLMVLGYHNFVVLKEPKRIGINKEVDYYYFPFA